MQHLTANNLKIQIHSTNCFVPPSSSLCGIVGGDLTRITVHAFHIIQWKHLQFVFTFTLQKNCHGNAAVGSHCDPSLTMNTSLPTASG